MPTYLDICQFLLKIYRPVILPTFVAGVGYGGYTFRDETVAYLKEFFLGPGRLTRISIFAWCIINWKSLPLVWTVSSSEIRCKRNQNRFID